MAFWSPLRCLLFFASAIAAFRIRAPEDKGESFIAIDELAESSISAEQFPAVASFMQNIKSKRDEKGRPSGGDEDLHVRALVLSSLARCWQPSPQDRAAYTDPKVLEEMLQVLRTDMTTLHSQMVEHGFQFRPAATQNPINSFGVMKKSMPHHHVVSLTSEGGEGRCLHFDYTTSQGPDPAGCRFFQASFEPIQKVTTCIRSELRNDPYWMIRKIMHSMKNASTAEVLNKINAQFPQKSRALENIDEGFINFEKGLWDDCEKGFRKKCDHMDEFKRTMEMLKRVEYKDWSGLSHQEVYEALEHGITQTRSTPPKSFRSLSAGTVERIISKCFEFPVPVHVAEDWASTGNKPAVFYKEALKCLPLIWDAVEVPRAPYQLLWFSKGRKEVVSDFKGVHPLCGRFALAPFAMEWNEYGTKYAENTLDTIGDSLQSTFDFSECFKRKHVTCKTLSECWMFLMQTHMPDLNDHCATPQNGRFDVTDIVASAPFKQSGFQCCCDEPHSNCDILRGDSCSEVGKLDYARVRDGRCETASYQIESYLRGHSASDYCHGIPTQQITAAALGELVEAPCLDGTTGSVRCLYHTPTHGRWGTVQCLETRGWCPVQFSGWAFVPFVDRSAKVGERFTLTCPLGLWGDPGAGDIRTDPRDAKAICTSVSGYTQLKRNTMCIYEKFDYLLEAKE